MKPSVKPLRALEAGARPQHSLPRRPPGFLSLGSWGCSWALAKGFFLACLSAAVLNCLFFSIFFFFLHPTLQEVKGHRGLLQRCWQSCFGGVSVEQDEGDASLGSRCVSGGTCSSRRERLGTEESRAAFLGGSKKRRGTKVQALEGGGAGKKFSSRSTAGERVPGVGNWD